MIELKGIKKSYRSSDETTVALNGIDLSFPSCGLVSIVGPSGCGKSTLLNVLGGLDRYDEGDIVIDGISSKEYRETDWDAYRNHRIGFVFQSYCLISHLSVLDNVMMALSLSGVPAKQRKEKAIKMLERVGLGSKIKKKPNQLSGGQQQRVAIARALINEPNILLCDEPTGALDSKNSVSIMELLKEISATRLVVMVSHNIELAEKYSSRLVRMLDGKIESDSDISKEPPAIEMKKSSKKTSMPLLEALKSSVKNLLTKKGRTAATAIAGSIGIIGIGMVLSLSSGISESVAKMEGDSLAGFPISISSYVSTSASALSMDYSAAMPSSSDFPSEEKIFSHDSSSDMVRHKNKIDSAYLSYIERMDNSLYNSISYSHGIEIHMAYKGKNGYGKVPSSSGDILSSFGLGSSTNLSEIPDSRDFVLSQYDVLSGAFPTKEDELALIVDKSNRLEASLLANLGFDSTKDIAFSEAINKEYLILGNDDYYVKNGDLYKENADYESLWQSHSETSMKARITAILRVKETSSSSFLNTGLNYTAALTEALLKDAKSSQIVLDQKANPEKNVLTGESFGKYATYESNMLSFGGEDTPTGISIYPKSFESKKAIKAYLDSYNVGKSEEERVLYSDLAESITATLSGVVNIITIVLSAIAAISLIVSSVMIAIIVYVSVIERTQEIGIMRALGARKKDITRIFSMESVAIGFIAGVLGVGFAYLLDIPVSFIVSALLGSSFLAMLPFPYALLLLAISVLLTLLAGIFPSLYASKKDPVEALRDN